MALLAIATALAGYLALRVAYQVIHYRFFHPLAAFPGPFWGSVTRLWLAFHDARGREVDVCDALTRRHGPVVRITPTLLLVSDATLLPLLYHRYADKTPHYLTGTLGATESIFNTRAHKPHARLRKIAAPPYSFTNIKRMEPLIDGQIARWLDRIDGLFAGHGEKSPTAFDFCPWAVYMAYDVVAEVGFGAPFGFVEQGADVGGLIQGMHDGLLPFGVLGRLHPFTESLKRTRLGRRLLVATPDDKNGFGALMRFRDQLIAERLAAIDRGETPRVDLLQTFLDARDDDGNPLPLENIKAEILIVLVAGADTTGTSFQSLLYYLLAHPDVRDRVVAELDAATARGVLSDPVPRYEEVLAHCPLYVACVRETMRLSPSTPGIFPRLVAPGGIELAGRFVPAGLEVTANPYLVHRDEGVYGPDAREFRPERWLESEERAREFARLSMTFGYGSRACLGQHVANMEVFKAPAQFLRQFDVELCDATRPGRYRVQGGVAFWQDMRVNIRRRPRPGN